MEDNHKNKTAKKKKAKKKAIEKHNKNHGSLSMCVTHAVEEYFTQLEEAETRDFYHLVMKEVEAPLLKIVMRETRQNQSAAAQLLGLSRGTLRKKLQEYGLL